MGHAPYFLTVSAIVAEIRRRGILGQGRGPISGDLVRPYLRRREGKEKPEYLKPELRAVLEKTLGVSRFQKRAMKVAIVRAEFTPAEVDELRRATATFKLTGGVRYFYDKLVGGTV